MIKTLSVAALFAAMSVASVPAFVSVAHAQANEPPSAPAPDDAMKGGGDMSKGSMSKGSSMSSKSSMKKSKKHSMKKHM